MKARMQRALGVAIAVAVAPLSAGAYAAADATMQPTRLRKVRAGVEWASEWMSATVRPPLQRAHARSYRVHLWVDHQGSSLSRAGLEAVLGEINEIWAQAGVCFQMRDLRLGNPKPSELVLRFIAGGSEHPVFGMYDGAADMWTLDSPGLADSPHPVAFPAARTASHELGHALGLRHYNRRHASVDALMSSGRRGYRLESFQIDQARAHAAVIGQPNRQCAAPELL